MEYFNRILRAITTIITTVSIFSLAHADISFNEHIIADDFDAVCIYACDFEGDEDLDILAAGVNSGIALWLNDDGNPPQWTRQIIDNDFYGAITVRMDDIDGDGDLDIIGGAWHIHDVAWWRNDGGDPVVWTKFVIDADFYQCHELYTVDIDGDGDIDIVGASMWDDAIAWWRNDGGDPLSWTKFTICNTCESIRTVYAADIDGDDDPDVMGGCFASNKIIWLRNDGDDPIVWTEFDVTNSQSGVHDVLAFDMDHDGDNDLLDAAYISADISWLQNHGGDPVEWSLHVIDGLFQGALMAYPADFDNDGDIDVAGTCDLADDVCWWRNEGGEPFTWTEWPMDYFYEGAWPVYGGDIDGDGDIDILTGSNVITRLSWWENDLYTGIEDISKPIPEDFELIGNYPNPFNAQTVIAFTLPQPSDVIIDIYNILGRKITSLASAKIPAGQNQKTWNAEGMPSGLYVYKITAGDDYRTGNMVILK